MMRWTLYLVASLIMQVVAWIITPILPLFAVSRLGPSDNANAYRVEPRLPTWLSYFDTPDNSLWGDSNFMLSHEETYLSKVIWLYRNSLYGFKWTVLSAPMSEPRTLTGQTTVDWNYPGVQRISMGNYWQYHLVKQTGPILWNINLGWLLNDSTKTHALFMCSPRFKKV